MRLPSSISAQKFVKLTTAIPNAFVDELFGFYNKTQGDNNFVIPLEYVVKLLKTTQKSLVQTLKRSYKEKVDYIVVPNTSVYYLTPECFKRIAMKSQSKGGEAVRSYLIEIENVFLKYREQMIDGMQQEINRLQRGTRKLKH
jgi:phage anti-repressor protein